MLFIKYLSDFHKETLRAKHKGNEERIKADLRFQKFILDKDCTFDYLIEKKEDNNLGHIINKALKKTKSKNKEKPKDIFRNIDFNSENKLGKTKERNATLRHLLEDFNDSRLDLRPSMLEKQWVW